MSGRQADGSPNDKRLARLVDTTPVESQSASILNPFPSEWASDTLTLSARHSRRRHCFTPVFLSGRGITPVERVHSCQSVVLSRKAKAKEAKDFLYYVWQTTKRMT